jgi:hypothetical protein
MGRLIIAGDEDAAAAPFEHRLGAAQHMPRRGQPEPHAADIDRRIIRQRLAGFGSAVAIARIHDGERFGRGQNMPIARPRVVGVPVGDDGAVDAAHRIDEEIAGFDVEPLRAYPNPAFWFDALHRPNMGRESGSD